MNLAFLRSGYRRRRALTRICRAMLRAGSFVCAPDGRILHATPAVAEMLGYADVEALIGANVIEFALNPEDGRRLLLRLECEKLVRHFELELRRCDAVGIDVRVDGRGFRGRNGQLRYSEALDPGRQRIETHGERHRPMRPGAGGGRRRSEPSWTAASTRSRSRHVTMAPTSK